MKGKLIKFPGNPRLAERQIKSATIIILPVIHVQRFENWPAPKPTKRKGGK